MFPHQVCTDGSVFFLPPAVQGGSVGIRRPACRQGAAGRAPRDRRAAQPKGGRGAKTGGQTRAACGGAAKGGMGASAAHPMTVDRIPERNRARQRPGSKAAKRYGGMPNGPTGLGFGQRQRRAGNQILCPVDFIAFNETLHGHFCTMCLLKLWRMRFPTDLRVQNRQITGQKYSRLPNAKAKIDRRHAFNAINATQVPHPGARPSAGTGGGVFRAARGREETAGPWQSRRWQLR